MQFPNPWVSKFGIIAQDWKNMCSTCLKFKQFLLCCCVETRVVILPFSKEVFKSMKAWIVYGRSLLKTIVCELTMTRKKHQNEFCNYRECVRTGAAGARTRRCLEHHLLHPQILTVQLHIRNSTILLEWPLSFFLN